VRKQHRFILAALWACALLMSAALATGFWLLRTRASATPARVFNDPDQSAAQPLPILFDAPSFTLTDQDGKPFSSDQLRGKVWVADFIFTTCPGLCPLMTQSLAQFQKQTPGSPVQMVSFSVDPEHDTPAILKAYAQETKADETRWHFLTGKRPQIWEISKAMKLAVGPDDKNQIFHSSHFLLVDSNGKVRGIYDTEGAGFDPKKLAADAETLLK
jgi:protein SCO1